MLAEHLAHGLSGEQGLPGAALEQHGTEGVEVGALVDGEVDEPGGLRREVPGRAHQLLSDRHVEPGRAGQPEVDEVGPDTGALIAHEDVLGLDVPVEDPSVVDELEEVQEVDGELEDGRGR